MNSVYVTRTLRLDESKPINEVLDEIKRSSTFDLNLGLRKLRGEHEEKREYGIKISVKQITEQSAKNSKSGVDVTDRIRLRVETSNVSYDDLKNTVCRTIGICNQLEQETSPLWDIGGTYSLTISLKEELVAGREVDRIPSGMVLEVFNKNLRVRDVEHKDIDEALDIIT